MQTEKGFTIIEVLLGVSIFSIGLLGITALLISSVKASSFSGQLTEASVLASNKIEELQNLTYGHAQLLDTDGDADAGLNDNCNITIDGACPGPAADTSPADFCDGCATATDGVGKNDIFRVYWNNSVNSPVPNSTTIKVIVEWREKNNTTGLVTVQRMNLTGVKINEPN